jgi:cathepsin A (carboxypeptidase C)
MWAALLPLLPLATALHFPHLPTPQDALDVAGSILHPGVILTHGNDMRLSSVPTDDHLVVTSAMHPVRTLPISIGPVLMNRTTSSESNPTRSRGVIPMPTLTLGQSPHYTRTRLIVSYLDVGNGRDLFFYFFESRSKPSEDPVIMWINGGPGCSSALGLFMELGPCSVKDDPKSLNDTKVNPNSWNSNANIFFLDEPIGVGFSRAEHGQVSWSNRQEMKADDRLLLLPKKLLAIFRLSSRWSALWIHLSGDIADRVVLRDL